MKSIKLSILSLVGAALLGLSFHATAAEPVSIVGVGGYDLVSYQNSKKPLQGNGNHVVRHEGVNYLFASKANAEAFSANVDQYLPAYGGYCAYGAAVGKKFIADPTVWEVVDGRLYLNLDNGVKRIWAQDIPGNIASADQNWKKIESVPAAQL